MDDLDLAAKILLLRAPLPFVRLALGEDVEVRGIRASQTELPQRKRVLDKLYEVEVAGRAAPEWLVFEVLAGWRAAVPERLHRYWGWAKDQVQQPPHVLALCLKPGARQGAPSDVYRVSLGGTQLEFRYQLLLAWEWSVEELLRGPTALLPFVPFAAGATPEAVDQAIQASQRESSEELRAELLAALEVFAENVFQDTDWAARMPMELIMKSSVYRLGQEQGLQEGLQQGQRKVLAAWLSERLGSTHPELERLRGRLARCAPEQLDAVRELLQSGSRGEALRAALARALAAD